MPSRMLVESSPQASASAAAQTTIGTQAAVILAANPKRKGFVVQNTGLTVLKLAFGGTPTQTVYHIALKECSQADDATGGIYIDDAWTGEVSCISAQAGGTCVVCEFKTGSPDWNQAGDWGTRPI